MDMVNKTQDEASDLPASVKFIREHLGVAELSDDVMLILYHLAKMRRGLPRLPRETSGSL